MGTSANNQSAKTINLIDCDVHHSTSKQDDLFPYLPRHYVEYIKDFGTMMPGVGYTNMPKGGVRAELWEGQDKHPGSNIELAREKHLDAHQIDIALLTGGECLRRSGSSSCSTASSAICNRRAYSSRAVSTKIRRLSSAEIPGRTVFGLSQSQCG